MKAYLTYLDTCCPDYFLGSSYEVLLIGYYPCEDSVFIEDSIKDDLEYVYQGESILDVSDADIKDIARCVLEIWQEMELTWSEYGTKEEYDEESYVSEEVEITEIYSYLAVIPYPEEEND